MEKSLPSDINAERATLGSVFLDRDTIIAIAPRLTPEYFYLERHAWIYEAQVACYNRRVPPDLVNVADELRRRDRLETVGGTAYLVELSNSVPTAVHVEYYAGIIERTALLRRLIQAGGKIAALGYDESGEIEAVLDKAESELFAISQKRSVDGFVHISQVVDTYFEQITRIREHNTEVAGLPTGFRDLDELTGGLQKSDLLILAARPAVGKCVPGWVLVDDPQSGARIPMAEAVRRRLPLVDGISADGHLRPTPVSAWIDNGVKPCYRLRTRTGRTIDATSNHPFLTVDGWKPLAELATGDAIAVPRALPGFGQDDSWPLELVRLLGYFIAEGGLTNTAPRFTNTDPEIVADFTSIIARHFPECACEAEGALKLTYRVARPGRGGIPTPNPVALWLSELGLWGKLAKEKRFPDCVWTWPRGHLAELLRALIRCDGSIYRHESGAPRIEFTVASEQLARDVHHAFIRFGILAKFYHKSENCWRVQVTEPESVLRYQQEIGWIGEKATEELSADFENGLNGQNGLLERIDQHAAVEIATEPRLHSSAWGGAQRRVEAHFGLGSPTVESPLPVSGRAVARSAGVRDSSRSEGLISSPELYWDEVESIAFIGDHRVYDLTVPDGSNFIAQDICVHNSSFALSIAYNCALQQRASVGFFALEMSREQLVQRILATHTGVDTQKLRTGNIRESDMQTVMDAMGMLSSIPLYIDDSAGASIMDVRSKCRRLQAESGLDLVIIDYLQLMQGRSKDNRVQEVSEISRGLKGLARELNIPVIALSQLSRSVESRTSHVPMLSDLRESGCIAGESLVYLPDSGTYRRIDELVGQSGFNVLALNTETWQLEPRPVLKAWCTGRKPVFKLTTRLGRSVRATANHKFLTIEGWRRLDELAPGMRLALPRRLPGPTEATMSDAELALLGHMIGDGCAVARQPVHYTTADPDIAEIVAGLAREVFGDAVAPRVSPERDWIQVYLAASQRLTHNVRNPVAAWLDELGLFDLRSYEKFVPQQVFAQPSEQIATFLRHLWATDGCIWVDGKGKNVPKVYYTSSSLKLVQNVQSLLLRLGINATNYRTPQGDKGRDQHQLHISGKSDLERFVTLIGAVGERKNRSLEALRVYLTEHGEKTGRDIIPREVWSVVIKPAIKAAGLTMQQVLLDLGYGAKTVGINTQNLSRARAARIAAVAQSSVLANLAQSDVYWDEIVSIEPDGEDDVYDLTVEGFHNFISCDIIKHNSIEQDADIVMFIYREELYDPETDKKGIAEIHMAKHRNGPTGVVPLRFFNNTTKFADLERYRQPEGY